MNTAETFPSELTSQNRLPAYLVFLINHQQGPEPDDFPTLDKLKREYILYLLRFTNNNLNETARILSISRAALTRKIKQIQSAT